MDIVEELRNDRERGARRLESEYRAGLMTLARRFCADEGDAEELVNRTFAAVVEGIDDYVEQSAFFAWMCRILSNIHAKDSRRRMSGAVVGAPETVDAAADPDADARLFREVDASILRDAIQGLPSDIRKTLLLHYFMDIPVREVARVLSVPSGTVKWRLHYARMLLAAKLGAGRPGVKMVLLALLLAAGLAIGGGVYALATAAFESRAESAEPVSHAVFAEFGGGSGEAEPPPVVHAESAENAETTNAAEGGFERARSALPTPAQPALDAAEGGFEPSTTETTAMNAKSLLAASASLALAAAPAPGRLVGLWTFARENPLEAKVGPDALEATGRRSLATSASTNALYAVTDPAVLGGRAGVLAAPVDAGIALPIAGNLSGTWCLAFDFYVPAQAGWVSFFQLDQSNAGDSTLYLKNGTDIGRSQYETVGTAGEVVGSWHQLVVSMDDGAGYVWYDGKKLAQQRWWSLANLSWIVLGIDGGGDNALIYFDEARLYDEARPADVFPDGENASVFAPDGDDGAPLISLGTVVSRYGNATLPVTVLSPGDDACSLVATIAPDGGAARTIALEASAAAGTFSFQIDDLGWANGASGTASVAATGLARGRTGTSETRAFRFSTTGASASLVGHWTFSRANPLEAKVGGDALEGAGRSPVATSATTNALYAIGDAAVLGDRVGVLAFPKGAGALLPVPSGLSDTWCLSFDFYVPEYCQWFSFFSLAQDNSADGSLFLRNGTDIGRSSYQTLSSFVGSWHQLVISMDGGSGYVWCDGTKLPHQRSWSLASAPYILLSMDDDGDDNLLYFDEARLYDEAYPSDVFPDGASAAVYAPDPDDGRPDVSLAAVAFADGTLTLSVAVADPGDDACSLAAVIAPDGGGAAVTLPLAASAGGGAHTFAVAFSGAPGAYAASIVATGLSRGRSATSAAVAFYVVDAGAAVFSDVYGYDVSGQRVTATGSLESLGEGDNTLYLLAAGADGAERTLAAQTVSQAGAFSLSGVFPGTGTVEARVVCSNSLDGVVWRVSGLPAATVALGADTSAYRRANSTAPDAAWNDPAAWTGGGVNNAGFPTADGKAYFATPGAMTTRLPAGSWAAGEMRFETAGVTNVFAGEGKDASFLDTSMWFTGQGVFLGISNATFRCDNFGYRSSDMAIRVDGGRFAPTAAIDLSDPRGTNARLEIVNGGVVETFAEFAFGATNSTLFVDGGAFSSQGMLRIANNPASIDVAIPEAPPAEAPVSVASLVGNGTVPFVVNVVENRSRTPGKFPILACTGGIPDGLVELGSVPYPERGEYLFFGYDGTNAETGSLRTGVWYRSNPNLPTVIIVR